MKPFFKLTDGLAALKEQGVIHSITGQMTVFPLCCSTGVVKGLGATALNESAKQYVEGSEPFTYNKADVQSSTAIHMLLRYLSQSRR